MSGEPPFAFVRPGPLATIGRALRDRLTQVFPENKFTFGWMPARVDADVWSRLTRRTPFIGIGFNRFYRVQTTNSLNVVTEWSLYLATKNESGQEALLFGDKLAPGLFSLLQVAASAIHGFTIPGQGSVQVMESTHAFVEGIKDDSLGVGTVELTVGADATVAQVIEIAAGDLSSQVIQWQFGDQTVFTDTITNTGTS